MRLFLVPAMEAGREMTNDESRTTVSPGILGAGGRVGVSGLS
ncbi:hypothetical protein ACDW_06920 [Acidovorax sp. DW039]|nr:hypothetical protein ACDW_06920 [Acidovorax sp. DW039]